MLQIPLRFLAQRFLYIVLYIEMKSLNDSLDSFEVPGTEFPVHPIVYLGEVPHDAAEPLKVPGTEFLWFLCIKFYFDEVPV